MSGPGPESASASKPKPTAGPIDTRAAILEHAEPEGIVHGKAVPVVGPRRTDLVPGMNVTCIEAVVEEMIALRVGRVGHANADAIAVLVQLPRAGKVDGVRIARVFDIATDAIGVCCSGRHQECGQRCDCHGSKRFHPQSSPSVRRFSGFFAATSLPRGNVPGAAFVRRPSTEVARIEEGWNLGVLLFDRKDKDFRRSGAPQSCSPGSFSCGAGLEEDRGPQARMAPSEGFRCGSGSVGKVEEVRRGRCALWVERVGGGSHGCCPPGTSSEPERGRHGQVRLRAEPDRRPRPGLAD